jgi:hypothetical protein
VVQKDRDIEQGSMTTVSKGSKGKAPEASKVSGTDKAKEKGKAPATDKGKGKQRDEQAEPPLLRGGRKRRSEATSQLETNIRAKKQKARQGGTLHLLRIQPDALTLTIPIARAQARVQPGSRSSPGRQAGRLPEVPAR